MIAVTDDNVYFIRHGELWCNDVDHFNKPPNNGCLVGVAATTLNNGVARQERIAVIDDNGKVFVYTTHDNMGWQQL